MEVICITAGWTKLSLRESPEFRENLLMISLLMLPFNWMVRVPTDMDTWDFFSLISTRTEKEQNFAWPVHLLKRVTLVTILPDG